MRKAIVFGSGLNTTLGLVRSLGEAGYPVFLVLVTKDSDGCHVSRSKYIVKTHCVPTYEDGFDLLLKEYCGLTEKPVVLFPGDPPVCLFDRHYDEARKGFFFFNAGEQARINHFMDKINTFSCAEEAGFALIRTWRVTNIHESPLGIPYPCLIKGANSTTSTKGDMFICQDETELRENLHEGTEYLIQEFIQREYELNVVGFSCFMKRIACGMTRRCQASKG